VGVAAYFSRGIRRFAGRDRDGVCEYVDSSFISKKVAVNEVLG